MENIEVGQKYQVEVIRIIRVGALVELEDGSQNLIHVSRISDEFVSDVSNFVSVGDVYQAEGVEGIARPVELSLRHLHLKNRSINKKPRVAEEPKQRPARRPARPASTCPQVVAPKERTANLDDMIAKCNKSYEDKFGKGSLNKVQGQSPKRRRSR